MCRDFQCSRRCSPAAPASNTTSLSRPAILSRTVWLAGSPIHMDQRMLDGWIQSWRLEAPHIKQDAVTDAHPQQLGFRGAQSGHFFAQPLIVLQHSHNLMIGKLNELHHRRLSEGEIGVHGPATVRREVRSCQPGCEAGERRSRVPPLRR